jgi:hypothetical protein
MLDAHMRGNSGAESQPARNLRKFKTFLFSLFALGVWVWILNWLFRRYGAVSYFTWFIKNGSAISLATAFLALVRKRPEEQKDLLSWHPLIFLRSCMVLAAMFFSAIAANLAPPVDGANYSDDAADSNAAARWDSLFALIMDLLMALAVLGWLLAFAPGFYLLSVFTGAPARREFRGTGQRVVVATEGLHTTIEEQPDSSTVRNGAIDISLGTQPFALTNALNAAVLFFAKMLITGAG